MPGGPSVVSLDPGLCQSDAPQRGPGVRGSSPAAASEPCPPPSPEGNLGRSGWLLTPRPRPRPLPRTFILHKRCVPVTNSFSRPPVFVRRGHLGTSPPSGAGLPRWPLKVGDWTPQQLRSSAGKAHIWPRQPLPIPTAPRVPCKPCPERGQRGSLPPLPPALSGFGLQPLGAHQRPSGGSLASWAGLRAQG